MAMNLGLGFVFTARDLASSKMQQLETRFSSLDERVTGGAARMSDGFRQLSVGLGVFAAGAATVAGAFSLADAAGRFEQGIAAIGAVTRATTRQLELLRGAAIQAGIATQFSPEEAVEGLQSLATAGQTAEQATRTLIPVLDLAAGSLGQLGVAQAAEAVVGTLNAYGLSADNAADVTDRLLRVTQLTNFQTRDFEGGLAKAAAAGAVFDQGLNDVLITMGLLRNRNIDASSSATAFRESVCRVGSDSRAQQAIIGAGVEIFDEQSGAMRSIVDVMSDFAEATRSMTDEERNQRVVRAFGARGLLAFNAILNASFTTMRDGREVTLKGAEAIAALRGELEQAEGTAGGFRDKLLDTFAGQKTLLAGTLQTFAVVLGEPFARVLKPVVKAVVDTLNALLRAFQMIPAPIKRVFAGVVVAAGGILTLIGGLVAGKAAFALFAIGVKALGLSLGGLMASLWPATLTLALIAAAVAGFVIAFERDLGGIGAAFKQLWSGLKLYLEGLQQLFDQGGFSGAVREELSRVENQGIKRFLISTHRLLYRLGQIWAGFKGGFIGAIESARPIFEELASAVRQIGAEFSAIYAEIWGGAANLPVASFKDFGQAVGAAIGDLVIVLTRVISAFARFSGGLYKGLRVMVAYIKPAVKVAGDAIARLVGAWRRLTGEASEGIALVKGSMSTWAIAGEVIGRVFGGAITAITLIFAGLIEVLAEVISVLDQIKVGFITVGVWIGETGAKIYLWFTESLPAALRRGVEHIGAFLQILGALFVGMWERFSKLLEGISVGMMAFFQPVVDLFGEMAHAIRRAFDRIRDALIQLLREVPDELLPSHLEEMKRAPLSSEVATPEGLPPAIGSGLPRSLSVMPAVADSRARMAGVAELEQALKAGAAPAPNRDAPPLNINVQVDGETIATAVHEAQRDSASRGFSPVPVY